MLYQILPDHKKIDFVNKSLNSNNVPELSKSIYQEHFKGIIAPIGKTEIGILSYLTPKKDKVNIFFCDDYVHINSNKLTPIYDLVATAFIEGHILVLDYTLKKNKENKERYHMRFYRAYKRLNDINRNMPLCFS